MKTLRYYARIWWRLVFNSFQTQLSTSFASIGYLIGKFIRIGFFLAYLMAIFDKLPGLKGYDKSQIVLFFMTFNIVDVGAQFLFRGLYGVKTLIEEGDFDKILTQPAHVLFRISVMGCDLLDLTTLIPIGIITANTLANLPMQITPPQVLIYLLLLLNAMVIAYAFHVFVGAISVQTQEFESAIWVYRDVMMLGRLPISIYPDLMRGLFVTVLPIGVMISFPAQALMGLFSVKGVVYSLALGAFFHVGAQWYWRKSLREYTSIST